MDDDVERQLHLDSDEDDLLGRDYDSDEARMAIDTACICMVETRSTVRKDLQFNEEYSTRVAIPVQVQEEVLELVQPLQQQIQQKDDHILQLKKQLEEVMCQVASLQGREAVVEDTCVGLKDTRIH